MRIAAKIAYVGVVVLLAGCSTLSSLNPFSSKVQRNVPAELVEFKPTLAVRTLWSSSIGSAGAYSFAPALARENLYVAAADGSVARLTPADGRTVWRINAGMPLTAGVGSDGNVVAVAGEKGVVLAFDNDGKLRWQAQASSEILSAPAVGQGLVIVRSVDNHIAAYDADSGVRRWTVQRSVPALTLRSAPGMTIFGSTVYVALPGGRLLALAISNGGPRWETSIGDPRGATELERITDLSGAPVVLGREVCAVSYQGRVACVDANTGAGIWSKELSSDVGVGADERFVFAADESGALSAFSRTSGTSVWRTKQLAHRRLSTPASIGRAVVVGDGQGYVHFLARENGTFLARTGTDGSRVAAAPLVTGTQIIIQTQAGAVVALGTE